MEGEMFEIFVVVWLLLPFPLFILRMLAKRKIKRSGTSISKLPSLKGEDGFELVGMYEPEFEFTDSDRFKEAITEARDNQKAMVTAKTAVVATTNWTVGGSRREGKQMSDRAIKLCLRGFNNECEAAIANVKWSNFNAMQNRTSKANEQINKLNESNQIALNGVDPEA